jgi:hypothetical protein
MACKVDGLHPHLAQQMADGEFHQKQQDGISPLRRVNSVPAQDRLNAWTLGGIAIDQVSKYKYLGVVYQEDGSWQAHAQRQKALQRVLWVLEATAVMQQSADKGQTAHGSPHPAVMYGAEVGHDEGGQRQDVSGRKESSPQHSSPASPRLLF